MAALITEFSIRKILDRIQNQTPTLNQEIAFVQSEAGLGFELPLISAYRSYDAKVATPDIVELEAFEIGDTRFPEESYSKSTWFKGSRTRLITSTPFRVAINHSNRGDALHSGNDLSTSQMASRSRLYGAALVRCFRNDPSCNSDFIRIVPRAVRFNVRDVSRITDQVGVAARIEFDFDLYQQQDSIGETQANTGALASVVLEAP